ncbi:MAG: GIY-YIG nuclease family protein [Chloroflexota bacterium]
MARPRTLSVGALGARHLDAGCYCYVGSARRGLQTRVRRHLTVHVVCHWHVDYLLRHTEPVGVVCCVTPFRMECSLARHIGSQFAGVPGFGCSDCTCPSHLFFSGEYSQARDAASAACRYHGCQPQVVEQQAATTW